jgi:hypothetical protein
MEGGSNKGDEIFFFNIIFFNHDLNFSNVLIFDTLLNKVTWYNLKCYHLVT